VYRIRAYETTYSIPRFNNAGSQVTVLLLQNPTPYTLQGKGGSITVSNDGRYGDMAGKAIALEPATGFSFDSPMVPRPR
jgi:hypothetical protein